VLIFFSKESGPFLVSIKSKTFKYSKSLAIIYIVFNFWFVYIYTTMKIPIVILGGGLAGLTAAIHLSKLGHAVTVIEKSTYPKHKVCGEYISNEVVAYFEWLGLHHVIAKSHPIHQFRLENNPKNRAEVQLPLGGFGISRYLLDWLLYQKALEQNCHFIHDSVTSIAFENEFFTIDLSSGIQIVTPIAIGSFGKRSTIDISLERDFIQKKSHWMALKSHYKGNFANHLVGLYPFEGGYCGVSKVEENTLNVCCIVQTDVFKKYKNIPEFMTSVLYRNKGLKSILNPSKPVFDAPLTISQISFEDKKAVENHVLMIGDAAGLIHPLCGNGMAMAIHSAKIAAELIHKYSKKASFSRKNLEIEYQAVWHKTFHKRLQMGRLLSKLLLNSYLTNVSMKIVSRFPTLFRFIVKQTHGNLIQKPF
jgi:flavin-dependent dehydrogenase